MSDTPLTAEERAAWVFDGSELFALPQDIRNVALRFRITRAIQDAEKAAYERGQADGRSFVGSALANAFGVGAVAESLTEKKS